jgi:hypothetical protein
MTPTRSPLLHCKWLSIKAVLLGWALITLNKKIPRLVQKTALSQS